MSRASSPVTGWSFTLGYDSTVIGNVRVVLLGEAGFYHFAQQNTFVEDGHVGAAAVYDFLRPDLKIRPEDSGAVAELRFCVLGDAAAGTYPLEFTAPIERQPGTGQPIPLTFTADRNSHVPQAVAGSITISGTPVVGGGCSPDDRTPPEPRVAPPVPEHLEATYRLADGGSARRGQEVVIPFFTEANAETRSLSFSIDFDEEVLEALEIVQVTDRFDDVEFDVKLLRIDNSRDKPGNDGVDEGYIAGAWVFDLASPESVLPPDDEHHLFDFRFRVRPTAAGGVTEIRFVDGARVTDVSLPVPNIMAVSGKSVEPDVSTTMVLIDGLLKVLIDIIPFIRGDSNRDLVVDRSDAIFTLKYLFLSGDAPLCLDAADANDDGDVDVSDPIYTLQFIFLSGDPMPPPFGVLGADPTLDDLFCPR